MKKIILITFLITLIFTACNKNNKTQDNAIEDNSALEEIDFVNDNMNLKLYVTSHNGARVRNIPSDEGEIIGRLADDTEVNVLKGADGPLDYKDLVGWWWYINIPIEGWVYSKDLTIENPADNILTRYIIGEWTEIGENHGDYYWIFNKDGTFDFQNVAVGLEGNWINNKYRYNTINLFNVSEREGESNPIRIDDFYIDVEIIDDKLSISYSVKGNYAHWNENKKLLEKVRE